MNSTHKPVVVTDPVALDTIYTLREIRVGDWLRAVNWHPAYNANGKWYRVVKAAEEPRYGWVITVAFKEGRPMPLYGCDDPKQSRYFFDGWRRDE